MDPHSQKLRHQQKEELVEQTQQQTQGQTFASVEAMLQEDAATVTVPPQIAHKLNESLRREPKPNPPWWQRLFRR